MNFKPEIKEISLIENAFSKNVNETVQCDIIVPDVLEDVGKILCVDAQSIIESKELSGGRLTVSGTVSADILYTPQSGGIEAIHTQMTFSHSEKVEDDSLNICAVCHVSSVEHSLYNSRKMNVRANIGIELSATRDISTEILSSVESDCPVEMQSCEVETVSKHINATDVIPFHETLDIPSGSPAAVNVLKCNVSFTDRDFKLLSNKAVIRGNLLINILYKGEDGELSKAEFTRAITEICDAVGAEENMRENIRVSLSPFKAEPTANAEGAMRAFFTEGKLFVETDCRRNETETVITDMFCTGCDLKLTSSLISADNKEPVTMLAAVRDIIPSAEINAKRIFDSKVSASVVSSEVKNGEITVSGKANAGFLILDNEGAYNYITRTVPFTYSGAYNEGAPSITAKAKGISAQLSGSGDAEIRFTAVLTAKKRAGEKLNYIANAQPENTDGASEKPSLIVYFTKPGDTLWDIAKRYGATRKNIISANNLGDTLPEGQKIIIPR